MSKYSEAGHFDSDHFDSRNGQSPSILSSHQLLNFDTLEEKKTIKVTQCALRMTYRATHVTQTCQADGVKHTS